MEITTLFLFGALSFPLNLIGDEAIIEEYKGGALVSRHKINDTKEMLTFFKSIENDWRYDAVSYAPATLIYTGGVKINCGYGVVVVNFKKNPDDSVYTQISRKIAGTCPDFVSGS